MIRLTGGPAGGRDLILRRVPAYLRVVLAADGTVDALDQLDDVAAADERIVVYQLQHRNGTCHVLYTDARGRRRSTWGVDATYVYLPEQPSEEILRDTVRWRAWALAAYDQDRRE